MKKIINIKKLLGCILFIATSVFASEGEVVSILHNNHSLQVPSILNKRSITVYSISPENFEEKFDCKKIKKDVKKVHFIEGLLLRKSKPHIPSGYCPIYFTCMGIDFRVLKSNKEVKCVKTEILNSVAAY